MWTIVEEGRVLRKGVLRPHVAKIIHLERKTAELDALCVHRENDVVCRQTVATKSRLWRILRRWEDETAKRIVRLAM